MEDDEDDLDAKAALEAFLDFDAREDARNRALAVHEAGHTVVARALGAKIEFVEIDLVTGNGGSRSCTFDDDQIKNLAVCVAGCGAEHLLDARDQRRTKIGDFRLMRKLLARVPEAKRRAARAAGYRLADATLKANADAVRRIADELLAQRRIADTSVIRIEGDELTELLGGVQHVGMDMTEAWVRDLTAWASSNDSVREMWLFGSRADGTSRPDSDIDIGLGLMPPIDDTDWALGNFFALGDQWRRELATLVGRHVSLEAITPENPGSAVVRKWVLLWRRGG